MQTISTVSAKKRSQAKAPINVEEMLDNARDASELLKALSHETRLVILCLLIDGKKSVGELEQKLNLRQPFVSQQLARLRADDLVEARREGKNIYYAIARPEVVDIIKALYRAFCQR
jgi:DNA-binding transcriptional ArsR family regulator